MSLAYFPMFPTDFDADTGHLTFAEDGAYNRLLRLSWKCPDAKMPDDLDWICRKARAVTAEDRALVEGILAEFFTRRGGKVFSKRLAEEWSKAHEAHAKRISAGSAGGRAKALKNNDTSISNATAMLKQPEPEPEPEREKREADASPKKSGSRATRLPEGWRLPKAWGDWAVEQGLPPDVVRYEGEQFGDYWRAKSGKDATKLDWEATWRNWARRKINELPKSHKKGGGIHTDFWTGPLL